MFCQNFSRALGMVFCEALFKKIRELNKVQIVLEKQGNFCETWFDPKDEVINYLDLQIHFYLKEFLWHLQH